MNHSVLGLLAEFMCKLATLKFPVSLPETLAVGQIAGPIVVGVNAGSLAMSLAYKSVALVDSATQMADL